MLDAGLAADAIDQTGSRAVQKDGQKGVNQQHDESPLMLSLLASFNPLDLDPANTLPSPPPPASANLVNSPISISSLPSPITPANISSPTGPFHSSLLLAPNHLTRAPTLPATPPPSLISSSTPSAPPSATSSQHHSSDTLSPHMNMLRPMVQRRSLPTYPHAPLSNSGSQSPTLPHSLPARFSFGPRSTAPWNAMEDARYSPSFSSVHDESSMAIPMRPPGTGTGTFHHPSANPNPTSWPSTPTPPSSEPGHDPPPDLDLAPDPSAPPLDGMDRSMDMSDPLWPDFVPARERVGSMDRDRATPYRAAAAYNPTSYPPANLGVGGGGGGALCKFFAQGTCRFGAECRFSHTLPMTMGAPGGFGSTDRERERSGRPRGFNDPRGSQIPGRDYVVGGLVDTYGVFSGLSASGRAGGASGGLASMSGFPSYGMAGQPSINGPSPRKMLKTCRFWMRGTCRFGDTCRYLHDFYPAQAGSSGRAFASFQASAPSYVAHSVPLPRRPATAPLTYPNRGGGGYSGAYGGYPLADLAERMDGMSMADGVGPLRERGREQRDQEPFYFADMPPTPPTYEPGGYPNGAPRGFSGDPRANREWEPEWSGGRERETYGLTKEEVEELLTVPGQEGQGDDSSIRGLDGATFGYRRGVWEGGGVGGMGGMGGGSGWEVLDMLRNGY
ncbi:hypothetical protein M427DRAFT_385661 [Gonapodya prolifera JEL478]|uniref:C3H1-type domain-containing protein n=1 Tax=Gonapodya prolifera (strain JEL478) TaxID=1344416 RepID=A0A139A9L9_GONPJ|nr:hypothetical protein M427DRAFT_385661 [Gonapodya prolifera JEL478]|eukprot:KXS13093.1 hypothetical protein M427DRAFT_385661 [Gonapodya prolifera JEL478]